LRFPHLHCGDFMASSDEMQNPSASQPEGYHTDMTQLPVRSGSDLKRPNGDAPEEKKPKCSPFGSALLRDYQMNLDPSNINERSHLNEEDARGLVNGRLNTVSQASDSPASAVSSPSTSPSTPYPQPSKAFLGQRPVSNQTMLKALTSRSSNEPNHLDRSTVQSLSASLSGLSSTSKSSFAARFAHSPCFFHQRFDDAVNVDRVLEEISAEDDGMSHSRLMQTATSVREISKQLQRRPIKRAVRTVMIVTKARDNKLVYLTRELAQFLLQTARYNSDLGVTVYVDAKLRTSKRFDAEGLIASNPRYERMLRYWTPGLCWNSPEKFDLVLTLGGDGTVLYTSWLFQRIVPPILSFSLGSLGFLTNFPFDTYKPTLDRIMEGSGMRVNMRMRFTCTVFRASHQGRAPSRKSSTSTSSENSGISNPSLIEDVQFEVLNELVIDRGPSPYVSNLELYGDTHLLTIIQADGCIISTPTGSTAYSLSAGGPLTHPSIPGILLTPICPHTLSFRPMVLSDTLCLRICVPKHSRSTAYASFDGKGRVELRRGDEVRVEAGRYPFPTVVGEGGTGGEWFESVRRALRWNTRGAVQRGFGTSVSNTKVSRKGGGRLADDDIDEEDVEDEVDNEAENEEDEVVEEWDIDADPIDSLDGRGTSPRDSGLGASEASDHGSMSSSPLRRSMSNTLD